MSLAKASNVPKLLPTMAQKRRGKNWGKLFNQQQLTPFFISIPYRVPYLNVKLHASSFPLFLNLLIVLSFKNYVPGNIAKSAKPKIHDTVPVSQDPTVHVVGEANHAHATAKRDSSFCSRSVCKILEKEGYLALPAIGEKTPREEAVMETTSELGL